MPIYEYTCPDGHEHEAQLGVERRNETRTCPTCSKAVTRRISLYGGFKLGRDGFLTSPNEHRRRPHTV